MMIGVVGQNPNLYTYHELSLMAAGADPKRFHEPTRKALQKSNRDTGRRRRSQMVISADEDKESFFKGLRAQFIKE